MLVEGDVPDNRSAVRKAIARYMNPQVYRMMTEKENLPGGTIVEATFMVIHLSGLEAVSKSPFEQVNVLNNYLEKIIPVIQDNNGFIEHLSANDFIEAHFGILPPSENHALKAVTTAINLRDHLKGFYEEGPYVDFGIGINTGEVFYGNIGSLDIDQLRFGGFGNSVRLAYEFARRGTQRLPDGLPSVIIGENTFKLLTRNPDRQINVLEIIGEPKCYTLLSFKEKLF